MAKEDVRKGPWTEHEDSQLEFHVKLFGDRRWDFIAKVSGLKRSGKSCRLRWVNYLHPGLKRGKMTPHEERLVLQLQSKWGNRWSRIARKLPGRTDNEIKNYWRTHMRKKAQESKKKRATAHSSTSSSSSSSSITNSPGMEFPPVSEAKGPSFYDTGGVDLILAESTTAVLEVQESSTKVYSMDEIWKDIELSEESNSVADVMKSPLWDFGPNLWSMDEEESKMLMLMQMHHFNMGHDHFHSFPYYNHMIG